MSKKTSQLKDGGEYLSNDRVLVHIIENKATFIRTRNQILRNVIKIPDPVMCKTISYQIVIH